MFIGHDFMDTCRMQIPEIKTKDFIMTSKQHEHQQTGISPFFKSHRSQGIEPRLMPMACIKERNLEFRKLKCFIMGMHAFAPERDTAHLSVLFTIEKSLKR
jgi:hypothetical protein